MKLAYSVATRSPEERELLFRGFRGAGYEGLQLKPNQYAADLSEPERFLDQWQDAAAMASGLIVYAPADEDGFARLRQTLRFARAVGSRRLIYPIAPPRRNPTADGIRALARALERWQTSFIANMATGTPASVSPGTSHCYRSTALLQGTCRYNVTGDWIQPKGHVEWNTVNATTGAITGSYYGNPAPFLGVPMPIKDLTEVQGWPISYGSRGRDESPWEGPTELCVDALPEAS